MRYSSFLTFFVFFSIIAKSQDFTSLTAGLPIEFYKGVARFGDYDNDGLMDIAMVGSINGPGSPIARIYRNTGTTFTNINAPLAPVINADARWVDYDNDGDLDLSYCGYNSLNGMITHLYQNINGVFSKVNTNFVGIDYGSLDWGDYDNDGDYDLLLTGETVEQSLGKHVSIIYRNDGGVGFKRTEVQLTGIIHGEGKWIDFDNDGDLDIALSGESYSGLYRNNNGAFNDINAALGTYESSSISFGDYDNDGDADLLLIGGMSVKIYNNNSSLFTDSGITLTNNYCRSGGWGDFNNDGLLDVFIDGGVYINNGSSFNIPVFIPGQAVSTSIADFDNDQDLDILITGIVTGIYENTINSPNTSPKPPVSISSSVNANQVILSWNNGSDKETSETGLYYNVYVSSVPGKCDVMSPAANLENGHRLIAEFGNATFLNSKTINNLPSGTYYWSVQTIDQSFSGSSFAPEQSFTISVPNIPVLLYPPADTVNQQTFVTFKWKKDSNVLSYEFQLSEDSLFNEIVDNGIDITDTFTTVSSLQKNTQYFWRLRAKVESGYSNWTEGWRFRTMYPFFEFKNDLPQVVSGSAKWGDYDKDGALDLYIVGQNKGIAVSTVYRNTGSVFSGTPIAFDGVSEAMCEWGDYDNDNDLDIIVSGSTSLDYYNPMPMTKLYKNNGTNNFTTVFNPGFVNLMNSAGAWADYDKDGDLDFLLCGINLNGVAVTSVFRNNGNETFTDINAGLTGVHSGAAFWLDYNADGDLDILIYGNSGSSYFTSVYKNTNGVFTPVNVGLPSPGAGSDISLADYNKDGSVDVLIACADFTRIYKNNNGVFEDINAGFISMTGGSSAWGDLDNDGDKDLLISGAVAADKYVSKYYRNDNGKFIEIASGIEPLVAGNIDLADYNNDGDLDVIVTGRTDTTPVTRIYQNQLLNNEDNLNTPPSVPSGLTANATPEETYLYWMPSTDIESPTLALTYNVTIGNAEDSIDVVSPLASPKEGNSGSFFYIKNLKPGKYFWKVQAIDQGFKASAFSEESTFTIIDSDAPTAIYPPEGQDLIPVSLNFTWLKYNQALNYEIEVSEYENFSTVLISTVTTDTFLFTDKLILNTKYYWRVKSYTTSGYSSWSVAKTFFVRDNPTEVSTGIMGLYYGDTDWADYDNDGDYDLLISGLSTDICYTKLYKNTSGSFEEVVTDIVDVYQSKHDWGDYDNDGDLDLVICGTLAVNGTTTKIYRNDNGTFTDINAPLAPVIVGDVAWGDYDNDGDLDLVLSGNIGYLQENKIYRNDGDGKFTDINSTSLTGLYQGTVEWGDYDNDGDLDLVQFGTDYQSNFYSEIYNNDKGLFSNIQASLTPLIRGSAKWGDFDNDGDLDLLIAGQEAPNSQKGIYIYKNEDGNFVDSGIYFFTNEMLSEGEAEWADIDNDGMLDIVYTGAFAKSTDIFLNRGNKFERMYAGFTPLTNSSVSLADYDNDGDLDIFVIGLRTEGNNSIPTSKLYKNNARSIGGYNSPAFRNSFVSEEEIFLEWGSVNSLLPTNTGTYALRIGTSPFGEEIVASHANSDGFRKLPKLNVIPGKSWKLRNLPAGKYYWSVQSLNNSFMGSAFTPTETFSVSQATGVANNLKASNLLVFPNPSLGVFNLNIELLSGSYVNIIVFDSNGKSLFKTTKYVQGDFLEQIDLSSFPKGMYFLEVLSDSGIYNDKLIVK